MAQPPVRILLVDDHTLVRQGLTMLLSNREGVQVVGEAGNAQDAIRLVEELDPDVVLMDINMPGMDGFEATRRIKAEKPDASIIFLTSSYNEDALFEGIKAGGKGFLLKTIAPEVLVEQIQAVVHGEAALSGHLAAKLLAEFATPRNIPEPDELEKLTDREREVLQQLTLGKTNKEIANTLGIAENTVKVHLRNILDKLHLANRVQAATYALNKGLVPDAN